MADLDDDRLLGHIGIFRLDDPMSPTGSRGVVGEAVRLVIAHAFAGRDLLAADATRAR